MIANQIAGFLGVASAVATTDYESISTVSLNTTQASVEFTGISGSYTHLQLRILQRSTTPNNVMMQYNSDTGTNYSWHELFGEGANASTGAASSATSMKATYLENIASGIVGVGVIDILDYKDTNKYKTMRALAGSDNNGSGYILFRSGLWRSTSAITSIKLTPASGSWDQYSSIALYGIK
jgi:hypothetical protein